MALDRPARVGHLDARRADRGGEHALGSKIADDLGFGFVLLIRITPGAIRAHGRYARNTSPTGINRRILCFADRRIVDKWLGRRPGHMRYAASIGPYHLSAQAAFGLSLRQAGIWGSAMAVEDGALPLGAFVPLPWIELRIYP